MTQVANTKTAVRMFFCIERRVDEREGVLLKLFTSFYDKIYIF